MDRLALVKHPSEKLAVHLTRGQLPNFRRALESGTVRVGFLGGSITDQKTETCVPREKSRIFCSSLSVATKIAVSNPTQRSFQDFYWSLEGIEALPGFSDAQLRVAFVALLLERLLARRFPEPQSS